MAELCFSPQWSNYHAQDTKFTGEKYAISKGFCPTHHMLVFEKQYNSIGLSTGKWKQVGECRPCKDEHDLKMAGGMAVMAMTGGLFLKAMTSKW